MPTRKREDLEVIGEPPSELEEQFPARANLGKYVEKELEGAKESQVLAEEIRVEMQRRTTPETIAKAVDTLIKSRFGPDIGIGLKEFRAFTGIGQDVNVTVRHVVPSFRECQAQMAISMNAVPALKTLKEIAVHGQEEDASITASALSASAPSASAESA